MGEKPFSISGSDYNQFIGKKIGDVVEGQFVKSKDSEQPLDGYKLEITEDVTKLELQCVKI